MQETEQQLIEALGARRMSRLRDDLEAVRQTAAIAATPSSRSAPRERHLPGVAPRRHVP